MATATAHVVTQCDQCGQWDDHPKVHTFDGGTTHHDCTAWRIRQDIMGLDAAHSQHPLITAKIFKACDEGLRGHELREHIGRLHMRDHGDAEMVTTGLDQTVAQATLIALSPTAGTATIGTLTITAPIKCRFDFAMTTTNAGASSEWSTASGYTAGGVSIGGNWAAPSGITRSTNAAVTVTNAPAQTWAGNELWDSSGSPQRTFFGAISGGSKTVNSGDTCTINSGSLTEQLG